MLRFVIGGSSSGKSEYAEKLILSMADGQAVDYIATMKCSDEETKERIIRHQDRRVGSNYITIENTSRVAEMIGEKHSDFAMLECVSNLLANEMYSADPRNNPSLIAEEIISLSKEYKEFVVVSNDIFGEDGLYDDSVEEYIINLGEINKILVEKADTATEVVCGIPVVIQL